MSITQIVVSILSGVWLFVWSAGLLNAILKYFAAPAEVRFLLKIEFPVFGMFMTVAAIAWFVSIITTS